MTTAQNVLTLAKTFVGLQEVGENHTPFSRWYGDGMDGQPWCATFVSFCTYEVGMPLPIQTSKGYSYCPSGVQWFKDQGRWYKTNPQPGDIVFYNFNGDGIAEHTGIVKFVGQDGIVAIEGNTSDVNQSNGGAVQEKTRSFSVIVGFGRLDYDGNDIGAIAKGVPPVPAQLISLTTPLFSSPDVLKWKQQMRQRGWSVTESSNPAFTAQDRDLLLKFQTLWNLEQDGKLGAMSWVLTWLMPIKTENMIRGDYGDGVYRLQEVLKKARFNLAVDGDFGAGTEAIVRQFQHHKHLTIDGQVGKDTLAQLGLSFNIA